MFEVTRKNDDRLDIYFTGKLDSDAMKTALDELIAKGEGIENGRMLYRIDNFSFPSLGAIWVELSRLPELFRFIRKFDRAAVVADKKWLRKISEFEGALIPGLEIKAFIPEQEPQAEAWLQKEGQAHG